MVYPMFANYVRFKRISEDYYEVYDCVTEKTYKLDLRTASFARKLNGKRNPYRIDKRLSRDEVDDILETLENYDLIRDKRFLFKSISLLAITLWYPKVTKKMRIAAFFLNHLLLFSWLPLLIIGAVLFVKNIDNFQENYLITGFYVGMLLGMMFHECGHAVATLGCGGKFFEMGFLFKWFIPGAYVLIDTNRVKSRFYRVQVHAAGVEVNFSLAGIALIFSTCIPAFGGLFVGIALNNLILALLNLTFVDGLDGAHIICELLCGNIDFIDNAKKIIRSQWIRNKHRRKGINGSATIVVSYLIIGLQILLPLLYIFQIVQVISCFF